MNSIGAAFYDRMSFLTSTTVNHRILIQKRYNTSTLRRFFQNMLFNQRLLVELNNERIRWKKQKWPLLLSYLNKIDKDKHPSQVPNTTAYKRWNCQVNRPENCCHLIPSKGIQHTTHHMPHLQIRTTRNTLVQLHQHKHTTTGHGFVDSRGGGEVHSHITTE